MLAKIKSGFIDLQPSGFVHNNMWYSNPGIDILSLYGYRDVPEDEIKQAVIDIIHPRMKYSKSRVMQALGVRWAVYRDELISRDLIDHFITIDYISENDKSLADFFAKIKKELGEKLKDCLIDE